VKTALMVPLAFLAGAHGFALFAPYLAVFLTFLGAAKLLRRRRPVALARRSSATGSPAPSPLPVCPQR
jgi:hypothetical protein